MTSAIFNCKGKMLAIFLTVVLLLTSLLTVTANAATTIKTQKAADSIKDGIRGIDVSKYNGTINWSKVAKDNVKFAMVRATCGYMEKGKYKFAIDPTFEDNAKQAAKNGLYVGAYHHACFTSTATMQNEAQEFIKMLKKVKITYPVVLDIELNPKKFSKSQLSGLAKEFCDIVSKEGYTVIIYSYQNFIKDNLDTSKLGKYNIWVANYLEQPTGIDHVMWQHTSSGKVSGISGNVDINIAYKNLAVKKQVTVDKAVAQSIKDRLASYYEMDVPAEGLTGINNFVYEAIQREVNRQWGVNLEVTNQRLSQEYLGLLSDLKFTSSTKGNITYLIQARLFFLGYYKEKPTSRFDDNTREALKKFQHSKTGLTADGEMSAETLRALLG